MQDILNINEIEIKVSGKEKVSAFEHSKVREDYTVKVLKKEYQVPQGREERDYVEFLGIPYKDESGDKYYWGDQLKTRLKEINHNRKFIKNSYFKQKQVLEKIDNNCLVKGVYVWSFCFKLPNNIANTYEKNQWDDRYGKPVSAEITYDITAYFGDSQGIKIVQPFQVYDSGRTDLDYVNVARMSWHFKKFCCNPYIAKVENE